MVTRTGEILETTLTQCMIGIAGWQLQHIPEVIAVAGGSDKTDAICATLAAGFVQTLTSNSVARALLNRASDRD